MMPHADQRVEPELAINLSGTSAATKLTLQAALRAIHRELTTMGGEQGRITSLLTLAQYCASNNDAEHRDVQSSLVETIGMASELLDRSFERLIAVRRIAKAGYQEHAEGSAT